MLDKNGIAKRIAQELKDGWYVNLGIGIPTLVANYIPENINVEFIFFNLCTSAELVNLNICRFNFIT